MAHPRAADDFPVIRARMEELRRERDQFRDRGNSRPLSGPQPYFAGPVPARIGKAGLLPAIRRAQAKVT
jgi:hypothetical protein